MTSLAGEEPYWVVQPLVDAGLGREQITGLVYRLGFEALVDGDGGTSCDLAELVADQPAQVQAAWPEVIGRMFLLGLRLQD